MTTAIRLVTLTLILSLTTAGPLAPVLAQQPAQPVQPDLFQERMKSAHTTERGAIAYNIGAGVANVFLVPGRVITCTLGGAVGIVVLALTFGSGYKFAAAVGEEGCGGKWIVRGEDLRPDPPGTSSFDWEQR